MRCPDCGYTNEYLLKNKDEEVRCPECEGQLVRLVSAPNIGNVGKSKLGEGDVREIRVDRPDCGFDFQRETKDTLVTGTQFPCGCGYETIWEKEE